MTKKLQKSDYYSLFLLLINVIVSFLQIVKEEVFLGFVAAIIEACIDVIFIFELSLRFVATPMHGP